MIHNVAAPSIVRYTDANEARYIPELRPAVGLFLDAGCGASPRKVFGEGFRAHVCVDFSIAGLKQARERLGARGLYVVGDLTKLPFREEAFGGVLAAHCLYHVDADVQPLAVAELHRVVEHGRSVVVFYASERNLLSILHRFARWVRSGMHAVRGFTRAISPDDNEQLELYYRTVNPLDLVRPFPDSDVTCMQLLTMREWRLLARLGLMDVARVGMGGLLKHFPHATLIIGKYVALRITKP